MNPSKDTITTTDRTKRVALLVAIAAALFVLYFMRLGSYPLIDADEPNYGRFAVEMAAGGDWLTPHFYGKLWFDKPPMFYWESAACIKLFGPNEFACRFPSAVLAVGLLGLVYLLASYDFGKRAGWISAIVMATCIEQIVLAHAAVTDMTFVFCLIASLYAYRRWFDAAGRARFGWMALCGGMMGFAMLTKGPVAIVLLGITFVIQLAWERRLGRLIGLDVGLGIAALAIVGFPWFVAMLRLHHDAFISGFLGQNNITRFLEPLHPAQTGGWYSHFINIPILFGLFFPWSLFLLPAMRVKSRLSVGGRLLAVWFAVVFVFFSVSKTVLPSYIFPAFPACAIFVGVFLAAVASRPESVARTVRRCLWVGLVFCLLVVALALAKGGQIRYPEAVPAAIMMFGILALAMALALVLLRRAEPVQPAAVAPVIAGGMIMFTACLIVYGMPLVAQRASTWELVSGIPAGAQARFVQFAVYRPSITYYLGKPVEPKPWEDGMDATVVRGLLKGAEPVLVFCKPGDVDQIEVPGAFEYAASGEIVIIGNRAAGRLEKWKRK